MTPERFRIAIQKGGRLFDESIDLLKKCGLRFDLRNGRLLAHCTDRPVDLLRVRDDDIPGLLAHGVVDAGIVGRNELEEVLLGKGYEECPQPQIVRELSFGACRLSIALPDGVKYEGPETIQGQRIATSYPNLLRRFLADSGVSFKPCLLTGSVEVAPRAGIAFGICDLVSSGATLEANGLREVEKIYFSTAVLVRRGEELCAEHEALIKLLNTRIAGIEAAKESKYVMFNAPRAKLAEFVKLLPGANHPTVVPLAGSDDMVAIHTLSKENVVWETLEQLKALGASSILIVPVEKVME